MHQHTHTFILVQACERTRINMNEKRMKLKKKTNEHKRGFRLVYKNMCMRDADDDGYTVVTEQVPPLMAITIKTHIIRMALGSYTEQLCAIILPFLSIVPFIRMENCILCELLRFA